MEIDQEMTMIFKVLEKKKKSIINNTKYLQEKIDNKE